MIGYIKGTVGEILADSVLVENNGIGYHVYTSGLVLDGISALHQDIMMYTYLQVRENELALFGFPTVEELDTFRLLIGVNGIGPKAALAIMSVLSVRDLAMAVMAGDTKAITRANGIGAKGAARVVMELKDKLKLEDLFVSEAESDINTDVQVSGNADSIQDTVLALVSLGYSEFEALKAVKQIAGAENMGSEALLKAALKKMF